MFCSQFDTLIRPWSHRLIEATLSKKKTGIKLAVGNYYSGKTFVTSSFN